MRDYETIVRKAKEKAIELADKEVGKREDHPAKWVGYYMDEFDRQVRLMTGEPSGSKTG